jgi:hypothetical protein
MAIGRNEPCPCGSNLKYKNCCADKSRRGVSKGLIALLAAIGIIAAVGVVGALIGRDDDAAVRARTNAAAPAANPQQPGKPQPGPAPPGKVWTVEHGHWHDVPAAAGPSPVQITPGAAPGTTPATNVQVNRRAVPQPPGEAPPGKVWSPEHGHWHDAPK